MAETRERAGSDSLMMLGTVLIALMVWCLLIVAAYAVGYVHGQHNAIDQGGTHEAVQSDTAVPYRQ